MTREIRSRSVALLATGLLLGGVVGSSSAMAAPTETGQVPTGQPTDSIQARPAPIPPQPGQTTIGPATATITPPPQSGLEAIDNTAEAWADRVQAYADSVGSGVATPREGRALYDSLEVEIDAARAELARALSLPVPAGDGRPAHMDGLYDRDSYLVALYGVRGTLLAELPDATRVGLFRLTSTGLAQVLDELDYLWLHSRYETRVVGWTAAEWLGQLLADPLGWVPEFLKIALAILIFLWWRRSVPPYLVTLRKRLLEARPIRRQNVRLAKMLWYFERIHWPIEWLVVLTIVFNVTAAQSFGPAVFVWSVAKWILIGWTAVLLIDAMASRSAAGRRNEAGLRRRSLWTICWWVVGFALGRELVRSFFGEGALFHWVSLALLLVLIPLTVALVHWWRDEVRHRLEADPNQTAITRWLLRNPTGLRSYVTSALGGLYLLYDGARRWFLRVLANSDIGRRVLAQISRSEIARQATKEADEIRGAPIPLETRNALVQGNGNLIEKVGRKPLGELADLFTDQPGSVALLVGHRGAGKSTLTRRLEERLDGRVIRVECPFRSLDGLVALLGQALDHPGTGLEELGALLAQREGAVVVLDDLHRLGRPVIGGTDDLGRLNSLVRSAGNNVSWLYTADVTAWQYMRRFRAIEPLHNFVVALEAWGEEEIARLVASRCESAGVDPDFEQLELPRQLDDRAYDSSGERNRVGFMRVLWDDSGGNPESALELWADSLVVTDSGQVEVRLSHPPGAGDLDGLDPATLFVLRTIIRLEEATTQEIADCLPLTLEEVDDVLQFARTRGIVDDEGGRLQLSWRWDRAVNRALARRNMTE